MKKTFLLFGLLFTILIGNAQQDSTICLDYFTADYCLDCKATDAEIKRLDTHYPDLTVNWYDINEDIQNTIRLTDLFLEHDIQPITQEIPVVFIGTKVYYRNIDPVVVETEIRSLLQASDVPCPDPLNATVDRQEKIEMLPLITIISAALVDSINPCAIAVLLILLTALMGSMEKKRAIRMGLAFTAAIFISYFLFGLGLFSAIRVAGLSYWFYKGVGFLAILIGLGNIKDYFWYGGGGFVMEIPRKWRPKMKKLLRSVTSPMGAFAMGFVVCLFELPCTGGPYLFILGLLAEQSTRVQAIPILLLYNFFFVLPLLIISALVYFGMTTVKDTTDWKNKSFKIFHLIIGVVMLALGLLVVFDVM